MGPVRRGGPETCMHCCLDAARNAQGDARLRESSHGLSPVPGTPPFPGIVPASTGQLSVPRRGEIPRSGMCLGLAQTRG